MILSGIVAASVAVPTEHKYAFSYSEIDVNNLESTDANAVYYNIETLNGISLAAAQNIPGLTYTGETTKKYDGYNITQSCLTGSNSFLKVLSGTVQYRDSLKSYKKDKESYKSQTGASCIEIQGNSLEITVKGANAIFEVSICSTSSKNVSDFALLDLNDKKVGITSFDNPNNSTFTQNENLYSVTNTKYVTLKYTLQPGTYKLCAGFENSRKTRINNIKLVDTFVDVE